MARNTVPVPERPFQSLMNTSISSDLLQLAESYGVRPAQALPALQRPLVQPDIGAANLMNTARDRLAAVHRKGDTYKDPSEGLKGLLRKQSRKDFLANPKNWTFSLNERRETVNQLVRANAVVGLIQAVMEYDNPSGFDVNIRHQVTDPDPRRSLQPPSTTYSDWLQEAARKGAVATVVLFASRGGMLSLAHAQSKHYRKLICCSPTGRAQ